jgi:small acid-soluble spore protein H (minor)
MDFERARQIVRSEEIINVLWGGAPVWIEHLDAEKKKAIVSPLDGALNPVEVPVADLVESPAPLHM